MSSSSIHSSPWPTYQLKHQVRLITAGSLFDGHDAAINIMRRLIQAGGAEVIHLGHNRSVAEIVKAALDEDVQGICISSYQGGHNEFFRYMVDLLKENQASHIKVFGGGGGTILPKEIEELEAYGMCRIYSPADGQEHGLAGIINDLLERCDFDITAQGDGSHAPLARALTLAEQGKSKVAANRSGESPPVVVGLTGTGGAGKSSLTDELILRFRRRFPAMRLGILCVDPSKKSTGGALLGDRIRMNALDDQVLMRSMATRDSGGELSATIDPALKVMKAADLDLIFLESAGIGQGDCGILEHCDLSVYVMTAEFGAPSQLEKIEMLDHADFVVINKFERRGSDDAMRDVSKQVIRNRRLPPHASAEDLMVFGTIASRFNDQGVTALFENLSHAIEGKDPERDWALGQSPSPKRQPDSQEAIIPPERIHYLHEIAHTVSEWKKEGRSVLNNIRDLQGLSRSLRILGCDLPDHPHHPLETKEGDSDSVQELKAAFAERFQQLNDRAQELLIDLPQAFAPWQEDDLIYKVRGREIKQSLKVKTLSGLKISKVASPPQDDWASAFEFLWFENFPGHYPYTSAVFPLRRQGEDPARMFAGEGPPARTNDRFHYVSKNQPAKRLSTAFDSVTLYGQDPDHRPDIYGKVGESGVSICTVEDMERLYAGFDLCDPKTSVSMTINGPAPILLAYFMNAAVRQHCRRFLIKEKRLAIDVEKALWPDPLPGGWAQTRALLNDDEYETLKVEAITAVRGTVQADILKEDQAQNTCIFSLEFALKMMGDIQELFVKHQIRNYYSVSISGYHIAEAGANPITQLAFTLANGFTYVETYLARGMSIDDIAPNLSFFFSNGLDPEYTVMGRVARRLWAVTLKRLYNANPKSQKLKYHIQTSGRSLHAQEIDFNDIRTTLQALIAWHDNCNSLHTNAYDEAITTPTSESVRRALAIQLIIAHEFGQGKSENILQGSYVINELTDLVENAVLDEFRRLSDRGGVLGAIETQYQRSRIQEESLYYESQKNSGELPIMGVNTFLNPDGDQSTPEEIEVARSNPEEKNQRLEELKDFHQRHQAQANAALKAIQDSALTGDNIFTALLDHAPALSLGQITQALYDVGGRYRRAL